MAYVDIAQHQDESVAEARSRRRLALAVGWKFSCSCPRCVSEGKQSGKVDDTPLPTDGGSKVESMNRYAEAT